MRISYEATLDEAVQSNMRLWELSALARRWKLQGLIAVPFLFLAINWVLYDSWMERVVFAILGSAFFIPLYLYSYKRTLRKRTRKMLAQFLGTDQPVPCEYQFDEDGLVFRRQGTETKFQWSSVASVNMVEQGIEVLMKNNAGIAVLPLRIFRGDEMKEWYEFASSRISPRSV